MRRRGRGTRERLRRRRDTTRRHKRAGNDGDTGHAPPLLPLQLLPLQMLMLPQLLLLLLLLRLPMTLLLRLPLLMLLRPLLRLLLLLRQHGWSMPDQSCCCDFFSFFAGPRRDGRDDNGRNPV